MMTNGSQMFPRLQTNLCCSSAMNDPLRVNMLPFDALPLYEQKPRFIFKMPRVVPDQKAKFESDELFRRLSRESEVRYTGYRDRPLEERQVRFQNSVREGHTELAFVATGTNLQLIFSQTSNGYNSDLSGCREIDFEKEQGKVHVKSGLIMNGVCVRWRGWIDLERLDGVGCLEYDEDRAQVEDAMLREQIDLYNQRLRDFEEKQRAYRAQQERLSEAEAEVRSRLCRFPMQSSCLGNGSHVERHSHGHGHGRSGRQHDQTAISANI